MIAIGRMFATGFDEMIVNIPVQGGHCDKSEHVESKSGTGYDPAPKRMTIFAVKSSGHHNSPTSRRIQFYPVGFDMSRGQNREYLRRGKLPPVLCLSTRNWVEPLQKQPLISETRFEPILIDEVIECSFHRADPAVLIDVRS